MMMMMMELLEMATNFTGATTRLLCTEAKTNKKKTNKKTNNDNNGVRICVPILLKIITKNVYINKAFFFFF